MYRQNQQDHKGMNIRVPLSPTSETLAARSRALCAVYSSQMAFCVQVTFIHLANIIRKYEQERIIHGAGLVQTQFT